MAKAIVIIPTFNESENIKRLIPDLIKKTNSEVDLLIVDDNSPDGTSDIVREFQKEHPNIFLMTRPGKSGLGTAYVEGFQFALKNGYDYILQMDADYSHDPKEIKKFFLNI